jgi:ankyrin repeat protein
MAENAAVKQLHAACRFGQVATIRQLLSGGVPVDALDGLGQTPLHTAIQFEKREAVELLLDRGANIEAVYDRKTLTPLLRAIWYGASEDFTGLLLDRGASPHAVLDCGGATTLHLAAARRGFIIIMGRLIDMGFSVDVRSNDGRTPLMWAALNGRKEALELLLGRGATINAQDNDGWTALHAACARGRTECVKVLLLRGIDPSIKNNEGKTAFEVFGKHLDSTEEQKAAAVSELKAVHYDYLRSRVAVLERPVLATASLLFSERFSDVVFVCGGGGDRIHAHRCVVAACSEQLSALLQGQWAETTGGERERVAEVEMSQSGAAVRVLLRFMYTGEAEAAALDGNLQEVLELAALYEQADLKAACEERGLAGLQVKTVVPLLVAAHLHDLGKLKQACIDLIKASWAAVTMSLSFTKLAIDHPSLWRETRVALGLPADEKEDEPQAKRARKG